MGREVSADLGLVKRVQREGLLVRWETTLQQVKGKFKYCYTVKEGSNKWFPRLSGGNCVKLKSLGVVLQGGFLDATV